MNLDIRALQSIITTIGFFPMAMLIYFSGMFFFWREAQFTKKDRSSVFDMFVFSGVASVVWGRISYIMANWKEFSELIWSIYPYEKYGEEVHFFRLLPWRFFRLWDGEFLFTGMLVAFVIVLFVAVVFLKKWRWREMMSSTIVASQAMFSMILITYGALIDLPAIVYQGITLFLIIFAYYVLSTLARMLLPDKHILLQTVNYYLAGIVTATSVGYVSYIFLTADVTPQDKNNIYAFAIGGLVMIIYFIIDIKRLEVSIETSSVRPVSVATNQPIRSDLLKERVFGEKSKPAKQNE